MVSPGFFWLLVCIFLKSIFGNVLRDILFICCNQFLLSSSVLPHSGVIFSYFAISVFYKLSTCVLLLLSCILLAFSVKGVVVPMALNKSLTLWNVKEGISNSQMLAWIIPFVANSDRREQLLAERLTKPVIINLLNECDTWIACAPDSGDLNNLLGSLISSFA